MSRKWISVRDALPDGLDLVDLTVESNGIRHIVQAEGGGG